MGINVVPASTDLERIFRDELDLQRAAHPGRSITLDVSGDVVGTWDAHRLNQVLGNLVSNAVKYGAPDTPIRVRLVGDAAHVSFSIANDGAAIPAQFMDQMFQPLARGPQTAEGSDPTDPGLGLGLYIAREIVRAHKGAISVRSDAAGTVFSVDLPR